MTRGPNGPAAHAARDEAFAELGTLARHELATVVHVARASIETCEGGDKERAIRRLRAMCLRAEEALSLIDAYLPSRRPRRPVRIGELRHGIATVARLRHPDAPPELELADGVAEVPLGVPPAIFTLAVTAVVDAFAAGAPGCSVQVALAPGPFRDGAATLACSAPTPAAAHPELAWAREQLARHGGALEGPFPVEAGPHPTTTAFVITIPTVCDATP